MTFLPILTTFTLWSRRSWWSIISILALEVQEAQLVHLDPLLQGFVLALDRLSVKAEHFQLLAPASLVHQEDHLILYFSFYLKALMVQVSLLVPAVAYSLKRNTRSLLEHIKGSTSFEVHNSIKIVLSQLHLFGSSQCINKTRFGILPQCTHNPKAV